MEVLGMRSETVKHIVKYYGGIPEAIKLLKRERDALEDEYNGLGGLAMDGMPHSSAPGNPTEALAVRVIENGVKNRLQEIGVQVEVLEGDAANIRGALDAVNGKYKSVIIMRLIRGYSWTKISGKLGVPDGTARNWHGRAVERLGEVLEEVPMVDELAERATRART
jgi:DNA-directed RNA polymerase specialized sigma24 family protein